MFKNLNNQDEIIKLIDKEYVIPEEYKSIVKKAIKELSTKNLKEETIDRLVNKPQSLRDNIGVLGKGFANFNGYVAEWMVCMEYNSIKNKDSNVVFSMLNPDHQSKADIIHIIKCGNGYIYKAGPDVKASENPNYILNSMERNYKNRQNVPILDVHNTITTEEERRKNLKPRQLERFNNLKESFPRKSLIPSSISPEVLRSTSFNYIKYIEHGVLPSQNSKIAFNVKNIQNQDYINKLKQKSRENVLKTSKWSEYKIIDINTKAKIDQNIEKDNLKFNENKSNTEDKNKKYKNKNIDIEIDEKKLQKYVHYGYKIYKTINNIYKSYKSAKTDVYEDYIEYQENLDDLHENIRGEHDVKEHIRICKSGKKVNVRAHKRCVGK